MTNWFAGQLSPGEKSSATFTIENPNDKAIEIKIRITKIIFNQKKISLTRTPKYINKMQTI